MKQLNNSNAANRNSFVGYVYNQGEKDFKNQVLAEMPEEWSKLHKEGYIHIHDLDAYGLTYNCLTFNLVNNFPYAKYEGMTDSRKIIHLFNYLKELFTKIGNEQSGGMAFANFDNEMSEMLTNLGVKDNEDNREIIKDSMSDLILWCNNNHTRMGQTSYYVTFNIGLAKNDLARFIASTLIDEFEKAGDMVFKPNIVFKVHAGINRFENDPNFDLYKQSLLCTARKMIPTYLMCDSECNKTTDPELLDIMGCRTRVVNDLYGKKGAIGRGNIANITINLPKIALEIDKEHGNEDKQSKLRYLRGHWSRIADTVKDILIDRYQKTCKRKKEDFPTNMEQPLWCEDFNKVIDLEEVFKHGTLSIGFIGLSEAIEVLLGEKYYANVENYMATYSFVEYMRDYMNFLKGEYKLNFSLLATAGELISGRFIEMDKAKYNPKKDIFSKGFYTNSFHVDVDSGLLAAKKIQLEGLFHNLCNGGCITYIELGQAPLGNDEGLREYIETAISSGVHYLGFNFPKDVCDECGASGVFDVCPICGSKKITRIRRVSGYLELLDGFTNGKKAEEAHRKKN